MSRVERLMSAVFAGVCVALLGPFVEHAATTSVAMTKNRSPRRMSQGYGALVGGAAHFRGRVLSAPVRGRGAEALIVDVIGDRWVLAADRAVRIATEMDLAKAFLERVVEKVTTDEWLTDPEQQLDRLRGLKRADDSGQNAENPGLRARRRELGGRWLGKEAAVARTLEGLEDRDLALEAEDGSMHDWDAVFHGRIVQEIAGGEVVSAVDHDVVVPDDPVDVRGGQALFVSNDLDVRIQRLERLLR